MKIYTGTGDHGKTGLFSGERVAKNDSRVEAYGEIDELSSVLGVVAALLTSSEMTDEIHRIQSDLLIAGALLATRPDSQIYDKLDKIDDMKIGFLESAIDRMEEKLSPLKSFILPGGSVSAAYAHIARTVCRRCERRIIALPITPDLRNVMIYINRLSDYLFVFARYCNHLQNISDIAWKP
jgi:cob(I)alamin adenosyltransferase